MWEGKAADTGTAALGLCAGPQGWKIVPAVYALDGWGQNAGTDAFPPTPDFRFLDRILENTKLVVVVAEQVTILTLCKEMMSE